MLLNLYLITSSLATIIVAVVIVVAVIYLIKCLRALQSLTEKTEELGEEFVERLEESSIGRWLFPAKQRRRKKTDSQN